MHIGSRFGLRARRSPPSSGLRPAAAQAQAPAGATPGAWPRRATSIFHGRALCYACHGANAQGAVGPNLTDAEWIHSDGSYDFIVKRP